MRVRTRARELALQFLYQMDLQGVSLLGMTRERIPSLAAMSRKMQKATNWELARIPGLLHERDFFTLLSKRQFPSTDYIRGKAELDYTPAPDCFHDIFGHMPMLTNPSFADFYRSPRFRQAVDAQARSCIGCFYGEYREPAYAIRHSAVLREWVVDWVRTFRKGMGWRGRAPVRVPPPAARESLEADQ